MTQTITRLYDTYDDAAYVVRQLEAAGFRDADVSVVASNRDNWYETRDADAGDDASTGAGIGAVIGGGVGLLTGLGIMAIPGVGPVVAAGWLVSMLAGAGVGAVVGGGAGGLIGALTESGVSERDAHVYAEGVRRGGTMVIARVDDTRRVEAERIMDQRTYVDPVTRRAEYEREGWTRFDPNVPVDLRDPTNRERV
jgi:hypothetical protein